MGIGSFITLLFSAAFAVCLIAEPFFNKRKSDKNNESSEFTERELEYFRRVEYNRTHLPNTELPKLNPDWFAVDKFIMETRFRFTDEGYRFAYHVWVNNSYEIKYILKSEFNNDTLRLIELLHADINWFYAHPAGETLSEESRTLENFLCDKYSGLSERSISRISHTYCTDNR